MINIINCKLTTHLIWLRSCWKYHRCSQIVHHTEYWTRSHQVLKENAATKNIPVKMCSHQGRLRRMANNHPEKVRTLNSSDTRFSTHYRGCVPERRWREDRERQENTETKRIRWRRTYDDFTHIHSDPQNYYFRTPGLTSEVSHKRRRNEDGDLIDGNQSDAPRAGLTSPSFTQ